jgi:hypothetical protein
MKNQIIAGRFFVKIIGGKKSDEVAHEEYVSTSLILISAIFLTLVIFPALLIVGPIKVFNCRLRIKYFA